MELLNTMNKESNERDEPSQRNVSLIVPITPEEDNDWKLNTTKPNDLTPSQEPRDKEYPKLQDKTEVLIPSQGPRVEEYFDLQEKIDPLVILHTANIDGKNGRHTPFFIVTLMVNRLLLHNCMLDLGASTNIMSLKVVNRLSLNIT